MVEHFDVIIIGAGPGGMTAGIYAARSGMNTVILEAGTVGGLVAESPEIENYPGFESINGMDLANVFRKHAERYVQIKEGEGVTQLIPEDKAIRVKTDFGEYTASGVIIATGARHRKLGCKGEQEFSGRGVSYCATCDGFFFRGKKVAVEGGGNTAVGDALYLHNVGVDVTLIHRRDSLRAEQAYVRKLEDAGIPVRWNSEVKEIYGENVVKGVRLVNNVTGEETELPVDGVFIAVGEVPNTEFLEGSGVKLDDKGFVITDRQQKTSVPRIYAAGDVCGGLQQIVVACGEGAVAATSAYEDITNPYWKK